VGHNTHTHTGTTRQPEPQLKSSSCSSVISSHSWRDAIPSHNSKNVTCLTPIPSHNSRDTFQATTQGTPASWPLSYPRSLADHAVIQAKYNSTSTIPPGATHGAPSIFHFQTVWRVWWVRTLALIKCLNFGNLIWFLHLRIDFSCIIYYWIFLTLIMQLEFNLGP